VIQWFRDLLYGSVPASFDSAFGLEESVQRLADATGRSVFSHMFVERAVGTVTPHRVSLRRVVPLASNSYKPFFIGAFETQGGRAVLVGRFTMNRWVKVFMSFWFGFLVVWTLLALFSFAARIAPWWDPLIGVAMMGFGVVLLRGAKWFTRNDVAWLSNVIRAALSQ
jgi:hypothetical protein